MNISVVRSDLSEDERSKRKHSDDEEILDMKEINYLQTVKQIGATTPPSHRSKGRT